MQKQLSAIPCTLRKEINSRFGCVFAPNASSMLSFWRRKRPSLGHMLPLLQPCPVPWVWAPFSCTPMAGFPGPHGSCYSPSRRWREPLRLTQLLQAQQPPCGLAAGGWAAAGPAGVSWWVPRLCRQSSRVGGASQLLQPGRGDAAAATGAGALGETLPPPSWAASRCAPLPGGPSPERAAPSALPQAPVVTAARCAVAARSTVAQRRPGAARAATRAAFPRRGPAALRGEAGSRRASRETRAVAPRDLGASLPLPARVMFSLWQAAVAVAAAGKDAAPGGDSPLAPASRKTRTKVRRLPAAARWALGCGGLTSPAPGGATGGRPERARSGRGRGGSPRRRSPPKQTAAPGGEGGRWQPRYTPARPPCLVMRGRLPPLCRRRVARGARGGEAAALATGVWEGGKVQAGMEKRGRQVGPVRWQGPVAGGKRTMGVQQPFLLCREGAFCASSKQYKLCKICVVLRLRSSEPVLFPLSLTNAVVAWLCILPLSVKCISGRVHPRWIWLVSQNSVWDFSCLPLSAVYDCRCSMYLQTCHLNCIVSPWLIGCLLFAILKNYMYAFTKRWIILYSKVMS